MLRIHHPTHRPGRAGTPLDPDDDALLGAVVADPSQDALGEPGRGVRLPHPVKDTIAFEMGRLGDLFRNPFSFLFSRSGGDDRLATYVIREHNRGRPLEEILNDRYIVNRTTPSQRARLLDRPEVVRALGQGAVESAKASIETS